uniref:Transmembrane protein n=1 Tax=Borely moumouvirus TaxID=2712067 RepID=A0A6G6ACL5_9VIRU
MADLIIAGIGVTGAIGGLVGAGLYIDYQKKKGYFDPSSTLSIALIGGIVGAITAYTIAGCIVVGTGLYFGTVGIYYGTKKLLLLSGIL